MHKHTLDNASLTSENMDCTEANTKQRPFSAPGWLLLCHTIGHIYSFTSCMGFVCVCCAI